MIGGRSHFSASLRSPRRLQIVELDWIGFRHPFIFPITITITIIIIIIIIIAMFGPIHLPEVRLR